MNIGSSLFSPKDMWKNIIYHWLPSNRTPRNLRDTNRPEARGRFMSRVLSFLPPILIVVSIMSNPLLTLVIVLFGLMIDDKHKHNRAHELATKLITMQTSSSVSFEETDLKGPLLMATKHGIIEIAENILDEFPEAIEMVDENDKKKNILHLAVEHRREHIFEFLKSGPFPVSRLVGEVDTDGNTPLHLAATLGEHQPMYVHGPSQLMPWELFWFEHVKRVSLPHLRSLRNINGDTAADLFDRTHKGLQSDAEKWVKHLSNTCMLISTIIATINFQAAFTVPGGFQQEKGYPLLRHDKYFDPFLIVLSSGFFLSLISLIVAALSAHSSSFDRKEYSHIFLPCLLLVGGTAFFLSVICTLWAFVLALFLELTPTFGGFIGIGLVTLFTFVMYVAAMFPIFRNVMHALGHSLAHRNRKISDRIRKPNAVYEFVKSLIRRRQPPS